MRQPLADEVNDHGRLAVDVLWNDVDEAPAHGAQPAVSSFVAGPVPAGGVPSEATGFDGEQEIGIGGVEEGPLPPPGAGLIIWEPPPPPPGPPKAGGAAPRPASPPGANSRRLGPRPQP